MTSLASTDDNQSITGLAILGTDFGCGKTVLLAGLAAMLDSYGFATRAIKPIVTGMPEENKAELSFISLITHTLQNSPPVILDRTIGISNSHWQQIVSLKELFIKLTIVELPGSSATPICFDSNEEVQRKGWQKNGWKDSADLAYELSLPCLLVAAHRFDALEKLSLHAAYIINKGIKLLGLVTVETTADGGRQFEMCMSRDKAELSFLARTGVPYLGCIKHSPSVSVPEVNRGNLVKLTTGGLEFLEVIKDLNLQVPSSI